MPEVPFTEGLHEVGAGVFAYLQPDGGWGWSNAGLVVDGDRSLLVDTLFDLAHTQRMLERMRRISPAAENIDVLVNTHANGDHCYGNELAGAAEIVATAACAAEMARTPPELLAGLVDGAENLGPAGAYVRAIFGAFDFHGITLVPPTRTFEGRLDLTVHDTPVELIEVGPAHTEGDLIAHLPEQRIVFSGDILFHGSHPIVWAGPVSNWIAACQTIIDLDPAVVVPGHGPVASVDAVATFKEYFEVLTREARSRFDAGLSPIEAARDISLTGYDTWGEPERLVVNITTLYREDFGGDPPSDAFTLFGSMAELAGYGGAR